MLQFPCLINALHSEPFLTLQMYQQTCQGKGGGTRETSAKSICLIHISPFAVANMLLQRLFADTCPTSEQLTSLIACINSFLDVETDTVGEDIVNLVLVALGIKRGTSIDSQ